MADCGLLLPPANGNVMQRNTTFASVTEYSCNDGFELVGNSTRTCQASGAWSGAEPTCESSEESNGGIGEGNTPQSDSMSDSMIPLIASVAVGVIATALLTVAIIVAVIIVMKRRKRGKARIKSAENKVGDFDNPLYSGMLVSYIYTLICIIILLLVYVTMVIRSTLVPSRTLRSSMPTHHNNIYQVP